MKNLLFAAVAVLGFTFVNAQETKFGAKGGLNMSSLAGAEGASSLFGAHLGGFAEIKFSEKFALQPELLFSMQGASYDAGGDTNMNYINIPVMAKYFVTNNISLEAGPQIGFLMSAKSDGTDVKDGLNSTDFGINLGGSYYLNDNMFLTARYGFGLSDVEKDLASDEKGSKNSVFQLSFGYKF
jgi:hypothetical protein